MDAATLVSKIRDMETERAPVEQDWRDIAVYARPSDNNKRLVFDSTALLAAEELAAGLHSFLTNPSERWFTLGVHDTPLSKLEPDALAWLEYVSELIYAQYQNEESGFNTCMHECYLDIASYGMGIPYQGWDTDNDRVYFTSYAANQCYIREDFRGKIDTICRQTMMSPRQIEQQFETLPDGVNRLVKGNSPGSSPDQTARIKVAHLVCPRTDRDSKSYMARHKRYASFWVCMDTKELLNESGYDDIPYHPGRWKKYPGSVYGMGPAKTCLPDIMMLNTMERTTIKAAQKMVDPPLQVPDDGFALPLDTSPASLIFKTPEAPEIIPLRFEGNLPFAENHTDRKREFIKQCFFSEWLKMEKQNKEMTAYEVADRRNEKLSLLSPNMSRLQGETHGPIIVRTYRLMSDHRKIPAAPASLNGYTIKLEYISPAARAQTAIKANDMSRYMQEITPLAQVDPGVLDTVDMNAFAAELARLRGTSRSIIRTKEEVDAIRNERQQQQQQAAMLQSAEPAAKAYKNIADAQAKMPMGGGAEML